jgi:rod shape determining protein RodA
VIDWRFFKRADLVMLGAVLALVAIGCVMIYSCTRTELAERGLTRWATLQTQLLWVALGLVALFLTMSFDYTRLTSLHLPIYIGAMGLLTVVLAMPAVRETHRWMVFGPLRLQPAEFAQLAVLITVAAAATARDETHDFLFLLKKLAWVLLPVALILKEPDLGTPVVVLVTWGVVMYTCGARWPHLAGFALAGVLLFSAAWFGGFIHQYQKDRLLTFMHPWKDPTGDGYHLIQSLIAIGHGGPFGQGIFQGTQTRLHFIPDQETDFIFTAIAEELGLVGGLLVLFLFGLVIYRCTVVVLEAKDAFGRLVAAGVTTILAMHVIVNVGMTMGLGPVKGMPLPFISYGGSNMLATMTAIGLVQNVFMRRHKIAF